MNWLKRFLTRAQTERQAALQHARTQFAQFRKLLDYHYQILGKLSSLEANHQKGLLTDIPAVWDEFVLLQQQVNELIDGTVELGGEKYEPLRAQLGVIVRDVEQFLPAYRPVQPDAFTLSLSELGKDRAPSVGTKNANLGEMKSKIGLPVPDGFAISAWAYRYFVETNQLQDRIDRLLANVQISRYSDLVLVSEDIREMVNFRSVPEDLAEAILTAFDRLAAGHEGNGYALRSSAVGEDTSLTFAGQYVTLLNVRREVLLDRYKEILASKFTPSAIHYLMRHRLSEINLAMGVVCMEMVDSAASGVVYTRDPIDPDSSHLVVNSIFGLGAYLVDGVLTPDVFHVSRDDKEIVWSRLARKPVKLTLNPSGGVHEVAVPESQQATASLSAAHLRQLAEFALKVEEHYGCPQDIEWALDSSGQLYLLQARQLKSIRPCIGVRIPEGVTPKVLLEGGTPICCGGGTGRVHHLTALAALDAVPSGAVLVAEHPSPSLVSVLPRIKALVTVIGGTASHLATLAREVGVPTLVGMADAARLPEGAEVTVDAGTGIIYDGSHPEWLVAPEKPEPAGSDVPEGGVVGEIVARITRLNVIRPNDPAFIPANCNTLHDILRFVHQKAIEEIFSKLKGTGHKDDIGLRLRTKIPLSISMIYLDRDPSELSGKKWIPDNNIDSPPMQSFWNGVLDEGWPSTPVPADLKGFLAVVGTNIQEGHLPEFSESSYAFISHDFMMLNLRMGYHFSTIEALATGEPAENYIRMQFKLGGAPLERRVRRIWLLCELLSRMGFENSCEADYLDSIAAYVDRDSVLARLRLLGRITVLTKQLDMSLSSDARAKWCLDSFSEKLGLSKTGA
jgi:pyruvate,water dikinase